MMKVETVALTKINPDPSNARKHSGKNLQSIKGSLAKFGQQKPIVVSEDNVILAGNGTYEAARELEWESISVVYTTLKGAEAIAYALADNRTTDLSEWDDEVLSVHLRSLFEDDFELEDIGFDAEDLTKLLADENDLKDMPKEDGEKKYLLEIEFPDEQAMKDEYESLMQAGLIVRVK